MNVTTFETCDKCGSHYCVGEDYRCPHGPVGRGGVIDDTVPGGARYFHNLGDSPLWISTKTELKKEMAKRGLVHAERANYEKHDQSPWATKTRLRPGQHDPFLGRR